jgi:hypothetical protein
MLPTWFIYVFHMYLTIHSNYSISLDTSQLVFLMNKYVVARFQASAAM